MGRRDRRRAVPRRLAWRLGRQLLRIRDTRRLVSLGLIVLGTGLAVLSVLSAVAAFAVVGARQDRTLDRALADAGESEPATAWTDVHRQPYGNRMVLRVDVALGADPPPPPPGVSRWPAAGEELVSPAFASASAADPTLTTYAPGRVVGTVGDRGLRFPAELVVYRGVRRSDLPRGGNGIVARTDQAPHSLFRDTLDMPGKQVAALAAIVVVCLGLPLLAFLAVAARLSASTRARRLATLNFLGVPRSTVRMINSVELLVLGLAGAAWALIAQPLVNRALARSNIVGVTWFADDTALRPGTAVGVAVAVALLAGWAARRVDRGESLTSARTRRSAVPRSVSSWRLVPLSLGVSALLGQVVTGFSRPAGTATYVHLDVVMLGTVLLTGFGLLWALNPLTRFAGRLAAVRGRGLAVRLGGARAAFDPAATGRLVAGLAVLVFAVGVAIGQTRDARAVSEPTLPTVEISVNAQDLPDPDAGARLLATGSAPGVSEVFTDPRNPVFLRGTVADCAQIGRFLHLDRPAEHGCAERTAYWSPQVDPANRSLDSLPLPPELRAGAAVAELPGPLAALLPDVDVLLTAPAAGVLTRAVTSVVGSDSDPTTIQYTDSIRLVLAAPRGRVTTAFADIYAVAPYSQPTAFGLDPDTHENLAMVNGYIRFGLLGGALMALLALVAALADRTTERRRADHELLAAGVPSGLLRRAHRWEVALTVGIALLAAGGSGVLGGLAWQLAGGLNRTPDWGSIAGLAVLAVTVGAVAAFAASALAPRSPDPEVLRSA